MNHFRFNSRFKLREISKGERYFILKFKVLALSFVTFLFYMNFSILNQHTCFDVFVLVVTIVYRSTIKRKEKTTSQSSYRP